MRKQAAFVLMVLVLVAAVAQAAQQRAGASSQDKFKASDNAGWGPSNLLGSRWSIEIVDNEGRPWGSNFLALDDRGNPHISYYDPTEKDLRYARWNGAEWLIETVDSQGVVGPGSTLALDSSDSPHISYYDSTNGVIKYAHWNGIQWEIDTVDIGNRGILALEDDGNPQIIYHIRDDNLIKHAFWNGVDWDVAIIRDNLAELWGMDMALDDQGNPHIMYIEARVVWEEYWFDLYYLRWNGVEWQSELVASTIAPNDGGDASGSISVDVDSLGYPHVAFFDLTYWFGSLLYWHKTANGWIYGRFADESTKGAAPSLVLDDDDNPHIAFVDNYWNYGSRDLKYFWSTGSRWLVERVKNTGQVDWSLSLALDKNDNPVISYDGRFYAGEYGLLMLARGELFRNDNLLPLIANQADRSAGR
jgi:hypothetical protein